MVDVTTLTVDQLLGIATKDKDVISNLIEDKTNVRDFIREYNVTDGVVLVPNYKVYYDYCRKWRPAGKKLSKIGFLRKFNVAFYSKRTKNTRYYLLDQGAFETDKESLNEAKEFDKRYRNKVAKKRKQKIESKVSSIAKEIQLEDETGLY